MQTFAVLVVGMAFGRWLDGLTAGVYLVAAVQRLPILAGCGEQSADFELLASPTSDFLIGFIVAAWTVGWLGELGWGGGFLLGTVRNDHWHLYYLNTGHALANVYL